MSLLRSTVYGDGGADDNDDDGMSTSSRSSSIVTSKDEKRSQRMDRAFNEETKQESRYVLRSRKLVMSVFIFATIACGSATYFFVKQTEQDTFQLQFDGFATEVIDFSQHEAENMFKAMETLSNTITAIAVATASRFPFVTIPQFDVHGIATNNMTIVEQVTFAPLVKRDQSRAWEAYALANQDWMEAEVPRSIDSATEVSQYSIPNKIHGFQNSTENTGGYGPWAHAPVWQQAPSERYDGINFDLLSHPAFAGVFHGMKQSQKPVFTEPIELDFLSGVAQPHEVNHAQKHSLIVCPVYPTMEDHDYTDMAGIVVAVVPWDRYFSNILHSDEKSPALFVVLYNSCGDHFTFMIEGAKSTYLGWGDQHESKYDGIMKSAPFATMLKQDYLESKNYCVYNLHVYPTSSMEDYYTTSKPTIYALWVVLVFGVMGMAFLIFDFTVARRQNDVLAQANRTNAIVSSLFPSNVRDRLLYDAEQQLLRETTNDKGTKRFPLKPGGQIRRDSNEGLLNPFNSKPIADLFPETTVLFADIVGFTAWSSAREPYQVFILLETLYQAFDEIAKRRRVFKVETIGDCYVAVVGLPDPRPDHAVVMARFAQDCLAKMSVLTRLLETTLGPDTADLAMRVGLHSGPVTAGVLRGEKGRFQLFGDTVNTAARMESNGARNKIHCSQETATLLQEAGKEWTTARDEKITAKGKGSMQTYWIEMLKKPSKSTCTGSTVSMTESGRDPKELDDEKWLDTLQPKQVKEETKEQVLPLSDKEERLVNWNTDVLCRLLKQIVARNQGSASKRAYLQMSKSLLSPANASMVIDEVVEIIELPELDVSAHAAMANFEQIVLDPMVVSQIREYVCAIATMYPKNHFHNFEHASHVTMSVSKLLSRIVAPSESLLAKKREQDKDTADPSLATILHDHTYGITSDPLTQFACVFSALIHDVEHSGVPNHQLVKEKAPIALAYKGKSVAEQNSIDLAWTELMDEKYAEFRDVLFAVPTDMMRFRQLVVNSVIATDIMDADLKCLRNMRWTKAFQASATVGIVGAEPPTREQVNRKATIILEHLIQASDIAHTMQHWHIYQKWNDRLFQEMYAAYKQGRADKNPADNWYNGELGFYDFYIIPLARKLKDCGVFGVSSDEYLSYAIKNRGEWELRGQEIVADMVEKYTAAAEEPEPEPPLVVEAPSLPPVSPVRRRVKGSTSAGTQKRKERESQERFII